MEAKISQFFESVANFISGGDHLPYSTPDVVLGCEREVAATKDESEDRKNESIMRLSWALVHSKKPEDVQRGIAMVQASLDNANSPLQKREKLYLLAAVGYYRSGDLSRSMQLLDNCLEMEPNWRQAISLQKIVKDQVTKDGVIGIGITATAVGLIAGGITAARR